MIKYLLLLLIASVASAGTADTVIYVRDNRLVMLPENPPERVNLEPAMPWEGRSSHVEFQQSSHSLKITCWFDVAANGWYVVKITQDPDVFWLCISYPFSTNPVYECWYGSLEEAVKDPVVWTTLTDILIRCGQNRQLLTRLEMQEIIEPETCPEPLKQRIYQLVTQLNDTDWKIRQQAHDELLQPHLACYLPELTEDLPLTLEQSLHIKAIAAEYAWVRQADVAAHLSAAGD